MAHADRIRQRRSSADPSLETNPERCPTVGHLDSPLTPGLFLVVSPELEVLHKRQPDTCPSKKNAPVAWTGAIAGEMLG